jgi:hypothetical protein
MMVRVRLSTFRQSRFAKYFTDYTHDIGIRLPDDGRAPDDHDVVSGWQLRMQSAYRFSQHAPGTVSHDRITQFFADHEPISIVSQQVRGNADEHHPMRRTPSFVTHTLKVFAPRQPIPSLHER